MLFYLAEYADGSTRWVPIKVFALNTDTLDRLTAHAPDRWRWVSPD